MKLAPTYEDLATLDVARTLLPQIEAEHGDTQLIQARRRAVLEAEIVRRDPRRKQVAA